MREGEITLLNAEPTVGSAPPWAGVTPASGIKKSQNGEDAILLSGSGAKASESYLARYVTGEEAGGCSRR